MTDMTKPYDGGAAFPFAAEYGHPGACGGMSLRDWFAGQALAGLSSRDTVDNGPYSYEARIAYGLADAMLEARGEK